jgi:hypothetical protein
MEEASIEVENKENNVAESEAGLVEAGLVPMQPVPPFYAMFNDNEDAIQDAEITARLLMEAKRRGSATFSSLVDAAAAVHASLEQEPSFNISFNVPKLGASVGRAPSIFSFLSNPGGEMQEEFLLSQIPSNQNENYRAPNAGDEIARRRLSSISPLVDEWSKILGESEG